MRRPPGASCARPTISPCPHPSHLLLLYSLMNPLALASHYCLMQQSTYTSVFPAEHTSLMWQPLKQPGTASPPSCHPSPELCHCCEPKPANPAPPRPSPHSHTSRAPTTLAQRPPSALVTRPYHASTRDPKCSDKRLRTGDARSTKGSNGT